MNCNIFIVYLQYINTFFMIKEKDILIRVDSELKEKLLLMIQLKNIVLTLGKGQRIVLNQSGSKNLKNKYGKKNK